MAGTNTEASDAPRSCMRRVAATNNPAKKGAQVNTSQGNQENGDEELNDRGRPRNKHVFWVPFQNLTVHFLEDRGQRTAKASCEGRQAHTMLRCRHGPLGTSQERQNCEHQGMAFVPYGEGYPELRLTSRREWVQRTP